MVVVSFEDDVLELSDLEYLVYCFLYSALFIIVERVVHVALIALDDLREVSKGIIHSEFSHLVEFGQRHELRIPQRN